MESFVSKVTKLREASGEIDIPLLPVSKPTFLHVGNIVVFNNAETGLIHSVTPKIALISSAPANIILQKNNGGRFQVQEVIDTVAYSGEERLGFTAQEKKHLDAFLTIAYMQCSHADTQKSLYVYCGIIGRSLERFYDTVCAADSFNIHEYCSVIVSGPENAESLRAIYALSYNFSEKATNVTIL